MTTDPEVWSAFVPEGVSDAVLKALAEHSKLA